MNQEEKGRLAEALDYFLNESLQQIVLSKPRGQEGAGKVRLRPVTLKGRTVFQAEEQRGTQAFHRNMEKAEAADYVAKALEEQFGQAQMQSLIGQGQVLVSKKGKVTVKVKRLQMSARDPRSRRSSRRLPGRRITTGRNSISCRRESPCRFWWIWES